jgi:geranylgeranyl pyrophosphate synthase
MNLQEFKHTIDVLPLNVPDQTVSDLTQNINAMTKSGGKRFRPGLLLLVGELFDLRPAQLEVYARAVEQTHLASLVHDDVIDASFVRRNHPTLNALKNNTTAILAGDFLLASVMGELAVQNQNDILIDLTKAIKDLADGEWLQYDLKSKTDVKKSDLEEVSVKKTGSLTRWCCTTPGKLAGHKDIASLAFLGERIGLIFQMADDIVDSMATSGKPAFLDIANNQINFVTEKLITLYPNLKDSVYAIKGVAGAKVPWTSEQYQNAINAVDKDINEEKAAILSIFSRIAEMNHKMPLVEIFELTITKIQLNYQDALN